LRAIIKAFAAWVEGRPNTTVWVMWIRCHSVCCVATGESRSLTQRCQVALQWHWYQLSRSKVKTKCH